MNQNHETMFNFYLSYVDNYLEEIHKGLSGDPHALLYPTACTVLFRDTAPQNWIKFGKMENFYLILYVMICFYVIKHPLYQKIYCNV
jgi:hypothetical protein